MYNNIKYKLKKKKNIAIFTIKIYLARLKKKNYILIIIIS